MHLVASVIAERHLEKEVKCETDLGLGKAVVVEWSSVLNLNGSII